MVPLRISGLALLTLAARLAPVPVDAATHDEAMDAFVKNGMPDVPDGQVWTVAPSPRRPGPPFEHHHLLRAVLLPLPSFCV